MRPGPVQVDLANGIYNVTPTLGDVGNYAHSLIVTLQGVGEGTVSTSGGQTVSPTYQAVVTNDHLTLKLQGTTPGDGYAVIEALGIVASSVVGPGFEAISVGTGSSAYQYNPVGLAWTYSANSGLAGNGSAFTGSNANAPQGMQVAFMQGASTVSQAVNLAAGIYQLSFDAADRVNYGSESVQVMVDGTTYGPYTPPLGASYSPITFTFTIAAGVHTITFQGVVNDSSDHTILIDAVSLMLAPSASGSAIDTPVGGAHSTAVAPPTAANAVMADPALVAALTASSTATVATPTPRGPAGSFTPGRRVLAMPRQKGGQGILADDPALAAWA